MYPVLSKSAASSSVKILKKPTIFTATRQTTRGAHSSVGFYGEAGSLDNSMVNLTESDLNRTSTMSEKMVRVVNMKVFAELLERDPQLA